MRSESGDSGDGDSVRVCQLELYFLYFTLQHLNGAVGTLEPTACMRVFVCMFVCLFVCVFVYLRDWLISFFMASLEMA